MEEMVDERVLKMKKMTVEGIDCHMRNPKKRLWTTMPGGEDEAIGFQRVLCGFFGGSDKWVLCCGFETFHGEFYGGV